MIDDELRCWSGKVEEVMADTVAFNEHLLKMARQNAGHRKVAHQRTNSARTKSDLVNALAQVYRYEARIAVLKGTT